MTMRMIISYPGFFAAAFPVCEAFRPSALTEQDIQNLKDMPIWFTNSQDDPLVPPDGLCLPTYQKLKEVGNDNDNVHVTLFDHVIDQSGLFKDEQGKPYQYNGHFSWVHVYNDFCQHDLDGNRVLCSGRPVSLFQWLGRQKRKY